GSGKSTIFKLILRELTPEEGLISIRPGATIAIASQAIKKEDLKKTAREFFEGAFQKKVYDIDPKIAKVLDAVNLKAPLERKIESFSGGEQARLLLSLALIQNPDILLLDEPTNNLDKPGIEHLTKFLIEYPKTVIIISHDAHFLNSITHGVLYLDIFQKKVEQYVGDYLKVVEEIANRILRERRENARLEREISERKEKMNFFAQKGGHMRDVARKMREAIEELEEQLVEMRQEDKTIGNFRIPAQEISGAILNISSVSTVKNHKKVSHKANIVLKRGEVLLVQGPNGIGKTTFLKDIASRHKTGLELAEKAVIGYYAQDFSGLNDKKTVYESLAETAKGGSEEKLRQTAAHFLLTDDLLGNHVSSLSEGQKGLLCFARFVLQMPNLLILDEPTNHINFRHLPIIAKALDEYTGALILVSHMADFVAQIKIDQKLDLGAL
ncbi:MAG TPA: ATP-binding cassette domain-containing protein, partial [Candidatus Paceibacterota bacterium]